MSAANNDEVLERYFGYIPSVPLAAVALTAFLAVSIPLFYQSYRYRNRLTYVLPFTAVLELVGYALRLYVIDHAKLSVYVFMGFMIIVGPNLLAFANYKVLGKIIQAKASSLCLPSTRSERSSSAQIAPTYSSLEIANENSPGVLHSKRRFYLPYLMNDYGEVHGNRVAVFFFLSDVAAILLQGGGAGLQTSSNPDLGTNVLLFGLASQLFFFCIFTLLAIYVYVSPLYQESIQTVPSESSAALAKSDYDSTFCGLFTTIILLFLRNVYRVAEFAMGYRGYLAITEIFMYVFDTLIIFSALILYIYFNFARFLSKADEQIHKDIPVNSEANANQARVITCV